MLHEIVSGGVNVRLSASFLAPKCKCGDRTLKWATTATLPRIFKNYYLLIILTLIMCMRNFEF
jgi:hypothetical protein